MDTFNRFAVLADKENIVSSSAFNVEENGLTTGIAPFGSSSTSSSLPTFTFSKPSTSTTSSSSTFSFGEPAKQFGTSSTATTAIPSAGAATATTTATTATTASTTAATRPFVGDSRLSNRLVGSGGGNAWLKANTERKSTISALTTPKFQTTYNVPSKAKTEVAAAAAPAEESTGITDVKEKEEEISIAPAVAAVEPVDEAVVVVEEKNEVATGDLIDFSSPKAQEEKEEESAPAPAPVEEEVQEQVQEQVVEEEKVVAPSLPVFSFQSSINNKSSSPTTTTTTTTAAAKPTSSWANLVSSSSTSKFNFGSNKFSFAAVVSPPAPVEVKDVEEEEKAVIVEEEEEKPVVVEEEEKAVVVEEEETPAEEKPVVVEEVPAFTATAFPPLGGKSGKGGRSTWSSSATSKFSFGGSNTFPFSSASTSSAPSTSSSKLDLVHAAFPPKEKVNFLDTISKLEQAASAPVDASSPMPVRISRKSLNTSTEESHDAAAAPITAAASPAVAATSATKKASPVTSTGTVGSTLITFTPVSASSVGIFTPVNKDLDAGKLFKDIAAASSEEVAAAAAPAVAAAAATTSEPEAESAIAASSHNGKFNFTSRIGGVQRQLPSRVNQLYMQGTEKNRVLNNVQNVPRAPLVSDTPPRSLTGQSRFSDSHEDVPSRIPGKTPNRNRHSAPDAATTTPLRQYTMPSSSSSANVGGPMFTPSSNIPRPNFAAATPSSNQKVLSVFSPLADGTTATAIEKRISISPKYTSASVVNVDDDIVPISDDVQQQQLNDSINNSIALDEMPEVQDAEVAHNTLNYDNFASTYCSSSSSGDVGYTPQNTPFGVVRSEMASTGTRFEDVVVKMASLEEELVSSAEQEVVVEEVPAKSSNNLTQRRKKTLAVVSEEGKTEVVLSTKTRVLNKLEVWRVAAKKFLIRLFIFLLAVFILTTIVSTYRRDAIAYGFSTHRTAHLN